MAEDFNENDLDVSNKLGALQSSMDSMNRKLDDHIIVYTVKIRDIDEHMSKVNILFGKIGVVTVVVGAVVATVWNLLAEWVKSLFK